MIRIWGGGIFFSIINAAISYYWSQGAGYGDAGLGFIAFEEMLVLICVISSFIAYKRKQGQN